MMCFLIVNIKTGFKIETTEQQLEVYDTPRFLSSAKTESKHRNMLL